MNLKIAGALGVAIAALLAGSGAQAAAITWADWTSNTAGTVGAVGLTYAGEQSGFSTTPRYYDPSSSFESAIISNAPLASDDSLLLTGGPAAVVDTITFTTAVTNPVMAIWSLGQAGDTASFNFIGDTPFSVVAGGPTNQYGGGTITQTGENVFGAEGNGVIQFQGTFKSISWTNPTFENFYGFTIGTAAVPEPASWALMIGGFGAAGVALRRRRAAVAAA
jgi:PEP-CTERM motif